MATKLIGVKYCGGCNPVIDRVRLVSEIRKLLPPEYVLTTDKLSNPWDIAILVCGCSAACADKPDAKSLARQWILVSGNAVDLENIPEEKMAGFIVKKILRGKNKIVAQA
jgi:hypothetical protein